VCVLSTGFDVVGGGSWLLQYGMVIMRVIGSSCVVVKVLVVMRSC
jgi:hypothetical protein